MRRHAKLWASMLIFVLISAPVSVSACDLSCWLDRTGPDCHSVSPSGDRNDSMSMPAGMNMDMGSAGTADLIIASAPASMIHTMFKLDFARNPVEPPADALSASSTPSGNITSCAEEACSHLSISGAPPNAQCLLCHISFWIAAGFSIYPELLAGVARTIESDTSPPRLSPPGDLASLRI